MENLNRYSRQIQLTQISTDGQAKLTASKVLIVGMGGLGCQVAAQLAGAGVGNITMVDHDLVDISNLHRQILFREADVGQPKVSIAKRECMAINSEITINAVKGWVGHKNVKTLIDDVDLVIDAADNMATSYLLSDACNAVRRPLLSASVNRTFGYIGVFCGTIEKPAPSMRAVFPRLPRLPQNCDTVGVTGPSVGVIASLQAQEAIKVLLADEQQLLGKLLYLDLWNYQQHQINFINAREPSEKQIAFMAANDIDPKDHIIDVRSEVEIIENPQTFSTSQHIPLADLSKNSINALPNCRIVLACRSGQRALTAAQILIDLGYLNVAAILPDSELH